MSESVREVSARAVRGRGGRRGQRSGALLALTLLALTTLGPSAVEAASSPAEDAESDDESDFAPFAVVVEHGPDEAARYCGGSLVSLRTALTSAWCARGRELAVRAAAAVPALAAAYKDGVRRVARVVFAAEHGAPAPVETEVSEAATEDAWRGASLDLALLELEAPFGATASARPILMATQAGECDAGACHAAGVRARGAHPLLRVADLQLARADTCAQHAPHWPAVRDNALCLTGMQLCPSDRGAGVVCGGKLCGVLSRSTGAGAGCGDTHAAQSMPRWRRFLQCAHTQHACGRDGECAHLCSERRLLPDPDASGEGGLRGLAGPAAPALPLDDVGSPAARREPDTTPEPTAATWTTRKGKSGKKSRKKGGKAPTRSPPPIAPTAPLPLGASPAPLPPRMEFDPSRADFKAGEYGDNAVDYAGLGEEAVGKPGEARSSARPGPTRSPPHAAHAAQAADAGHAAYDEPLYEPAPRAQPPSAAFHAPFGSAHRVSSSAPTVSIMKNDDPARRTATNSASTHSPLFYYTFYILYIFVFIVNIVY